MRIDNVRVRQVAMPRLDPTWRTASYAANAVDACIVEIDADGASGVGGLAARPPGRGTPADELTAQIRGPVSKRLVGADALERRDLLSALQEAGVHRSVVAAVDMALYDLIGKATGLPFHAFWGGAARRSIPIVRMVGIKSPSDLVASTGELVEEGYSHFKIKLGTGVAEDLERIRALRSEYGDAIWIAIDGNGAYAIDDAIELSRALAPYDVRLIEQPIDYTDLEGLARLSEASPIPIMADQYVSGLDSARQVCERRAAHMVSIKLGQTGTIDECRRIAELCLAFGIRVHVGGSARPVVTDAAHAQLVASIPGVEPEAEVGECFALTNDITGGVSVRDGSWQITDAHGLGVTVLQ
jgi:L-Ala-D/L-Glu epimerase